MTPLSVFLYGVAGAATFNVLSVLALFAWFQLSERVDDDLDDEMRIW